MWPFTKKAGPAATSDLPLSADAIEAGILAVSGQGVHMAVLYATMLDFQAEVLNSENIGDFLHLIQSPPEFTDAGIARAIYRVTHGADVMCKGPGFESFVYGSPGTEKSALKPLLEPYRLAVAKHGAGAVFASAGFDVADFLKRTSVTWRQNDIDAIMAKLEEKRPFLAPLLMRARAKGRNKYGDIDYADFFDELREFLEAYFNEGKLRFFQSYYPLALCLPIIDQWLVETESTLAMPLDGIDFEHWCAARIAEQGWSVRVSKATGDQGIDIEAMRDGLVVAIQCKRYSQPIGNKSVQEAYTGATHYRADRAVVIGTGGFTRAAIELAENTGVILIDAENVAAFSSLVASP
jgi:hypothetical protein